VEDLGTNEGRGSIHEGGLAIEEDLVLWAKVDAMLPQNPKAYGAGFWGTTVFIHLILLNKAHGHGGLVPAQFVAPEYLARYIQLDRSPQAEQAEDLIRFGLNEAARANLIVLCAEGVIISGWDETWDKQAISGAERTRKWREKQDGDGDASQNVTGDGGVTKVTCDARSDQSRSDQIRSDKDLPSKNATGVSDEVPKPKGKKALDPDKIPDQAHTAAQVLADFVVENTPDGKLAAMAPAKRQAAILKSADEIRKANSADGMTWAQIDAMIHWCQADQFWAPIVQDGKKLRKHWDTMAGQRASGDRGPAQDVRVGRVEPLPHSAHPGGEIEL
jgi:hypothetical protein